MFCDREKALPPWAAGLIIILAILVPVILLCRLRNIYIISRIFLSRLVYFVSDDGTVFRKTRRALSGRLLCWARAGHHGGLGAVYSNNHGARIPAAQWA
jgi:phospho-N-acetylmuramoyl-pentapeptide-transferase